VPSRRSRRDGYCGVVLEKSLFEAAQQDTHKANAVMSAMSGKLTPGEQA
jgi:hypothetical protein